MREATRFISAYEYYKKEKRTDTTYFVDEATHEFKNMEEVAMYLKQSILGFRSITNFPNTSINITNSGKISFKIQRPLNNSELEELAIELSKFSRK